MRKRVLAGWSAQPRAHAHHDLAPAQLIANMLGDESIDLGAHNVVTTSWCATLRVGSLTGVQPTVRVTFFDPDYILLRHDVIFHDG